LSSNWVWAIAIDAEGNIWIGDGGLTKFDGINWTVYNTDNSKLPCDNVTALAIDMQGNKWIGTGFGYNGYSFGSLAVYREGGVITGVEEKHRTELPPTFSLSQNYPNPFNATTQISFNVPRRSHVKITIYNVLGQLVRELADRDYERGVHHVRWNGADNVNIPVSSGIYFYRMTAGGNAGAITKRMILLR